MSYLATYNFLGSVHIEASELSLAEACRKAVRLFDWHITAIAGRELRTRVTALCLGSQAAWELLRDNAGDNLATARILDEEYNEYSSLSGTEGVRIVGVIFKRGDTTLRFLHVGEGFACRIQTPRFTVETGSYEAFFPAVREAMTFEYLKMLANHGMPECTSIGL